MSPDTHPQVDQVLRMAEQIQSVIDEQAHKLKTESFCGADEADTVRVTLDGRLRLTGLDIEPGLLRLGAGAVERRVNEAMRNAQAVVTEAGDAERERILEAVARIAAPLQQMIGLPGAETV
ncbi:YbaB/EbfC family nucleoid-associated protein [Mycobacterium sp. Lab-001]|uniref:YbaB/EbfC family nucleoid-associated protein n=1 Tax=Mycobacterium sp. Lab-001 TaxID=3410136 RepID=UPI003D176560